MALTQVSRGLLSTSIVDNGNATAITIDSSENVGIGVTPFSAGGNGSNLMIGDPASAVGAGLTIGATTTGDIQFGDATTGAGRYAGLLRYQHADDVMAFWTNSSERMRINSSGNLLVGTTAGSFNAKITAEGGGNYTFESRQSVTTLIGHFVFRNGNGVAGSIQTSGTTTSYNTSSDQRLKENIVDAPSASDDIDAIQVRSFDWKADGSHQKYGMVAQELQTVAPEAVSAPENPEEMMGVDYSKLVPMLVKEIQSLRNRVAELENN